MAANKKWEGSEGAALGAEAFKAGLRAMQKSIASTEGTADWKLELAGIYDGLDDDALLYAGTLDQMTRPVDLARTQKAARYWFGKNQLLRAILRLKKAFWNYKFAVRPTDPNLSDKQRKQWRDWEKQKMAIVRRMVSEIWEDYFIEQAVVVFWRDGLAGAESDKVEGRRKAIGKPLVIRPERCRYTDIMGVEKLLITLEYTQAQLQSTKLTDVNRYAKREFEPDPAKGEFFRVLTTGRTGDGFPRPDIEMMFEPLTMEEGLQFADRCWSLFAQTTFRLWKIGYEIRNGPYAGQAHHHMKKEDSQAMRAAVANKRGAVDMAVNFDRTVEFPFPSLDRYDPKKYLSTWTKLAQWAGPIGMLFLGGQNLQPEVLQKMAQGEAMEDRDRMKLFLEDVIENGLKPPAGIEWEVRWGNEIFIDTRQFIELTKVLLTQGALSQRSALEAAGFDQVEEWDNKDEEFAASQSEKKKGRVLPVYDKDHGKRPGEPSGRPSGTKG